MKSNIGIHEELQRLTNYLQLSLQPSCTSEDCENNLIPFSIKGSYRSYGKAKSGATRYQCAACRKTFSIPKPSQWQHDTHYNQDIFLFADNIVV